MGADLLLHHVWIARGVEPNWEAAKSTIQQATDEQIEELESYEYSGSDTPDDYRQLLLNELDDIRDVWDGHNRRDAYKVHLGPIDCLLTGGMSWGDDPCEFFGTIGRFLETPAVEAAGFFQEIP